MKVVVLGFIMLFTSINSNTYDKVIIRYKNVHSLPIIYEGKIDVEKNADIELLISDLPLLNTLSKKIFTDNNLELVKGTSKGEIEKNAVAIFRFYRLDLNVKTIIIDSRLHLCFEDQMGVYKLNNKGKQVLSDNFPFFYFTN